MVMQNMKVLIVDDEEHVREAIMYIVDWERFHITEQYMAADVDEAEKIIEEHSPGVIFCDIKMPGRSGIELIEKLKNEKSNIQTIVISGYDDFKYLRAVIQAKAVDYILKPVRKVEVEKALEQAIKNYKEAVITEDWRQITEVRPDEAVVSGAAIAEVKKYLDDHFAEKITLEKLGSIFYLSPQYISNRFKEVYDISLIEYVTRLKLQKAKTLLIQTGQSVSEIAYGLGFSSEAYFSKVFKKHEEVSPKNYRDKFQKG
jgi:two-component system, response regulator YesN